MAVTRRFTVRSASARPLGLLIAVWLVWLLVIGAVFVAVGSPAGA